MLSYFKSKEFFLSLLGVIVAGILMYLFIFYVFLPSYTHHGSSAIVPDVNKLPYKEAMDKLSDADLDYEVRDSIYLPNVAPQSVVKQYPLPASTVKPGRTVFLTLNKTVPPMVKMPKVVDLSVYQAKARLESWKLQVEDIRKVPDIAKNVVLRTLYKGKEIKTGTEIPQGTGIVLIIGEGLKESFVEVPNVIGMSYSDALQALSEVGLNINPVYDKSNGDGRIYDQYPKPEGDSVKEGWPVDIFIRGTAPEGVEAPLEEGQEIEKD